MSDDVVMKPFSDPLKPHKNQQSPISKVPEDVLLCIFIILSDWDGTSRTLVTRISHVCREWRHIAIGAPLLWTRPLSSWHPSWTTLALQRARTAAIEVDLDFVESGGVTDISKDLLGHISHTSTLDMRGSCDHLDEAQKLIAGNDAIQLKNLSIWCSDYKSAEPPRSFVLSPTTFRSTPQLRSLFLDRVDIDFSSPFLRNLTTLWLQHLSPTAVPTWSKLIEVLRAMPLLTDLQLCHVVPRSDTSVAPLELVDLESLRNFSLECSTASQVYVVLGLVLFPPLSNMTLRWDIDDLEQDQSIIFQSIAESVHAQHFGPQVGTLDIHSVPALGCIQVWAMVHGSTMLSLCFPENSMEIGDVRVIENFVDILHISNIVIFELKIGHEYDHSSLLRLAGRMPHLEYLTTGHLTAFKFIDILDMEPLMPEPGSSPQSCLPKLEYITWAGGDFSGHEVWVDKVAAGIFSRRRERGLGVKTLEFNDVENLSSHLVGLLEKGVTEVLVRNYDS